ncbi:MAG TPA: hypothetical protein VFD04_00190 [Actinomycetes bacterium]|nr:hypothetical protein [Actinomycetes bacterium]
MAIKGKTKRSQGRPVRRPAAGPRIQAVERRLPWYRATAFPVTLAVIALVGTLVAAANRVQEGYARDDVRRFTELLRVQTDQLPSVLGAGSTQVPGFASAGDLTGGKVSPKVFQVRATGWSAKLQQIQQKVDAIQLGEAPGQTEFNGNPNNSIGGHVPLLTSIRETYAAGVGMYGSAADTFQRAAEAPPRSALAKALLTQAQGEVTKAAAVMDAAADALARLTARYRLDTTRQLPGESSNAYGSRYAPAQPTQASIPG